ncbi:MAG TPA: DUF2818 family protein [Paenalcaligenes sp.]|nr:DUF2818 family protein [Paenalcaligenes sp.]
MNQSVAVWLLIGLSLVTANLSFITQRTLIFFPWQQQGEPTGSSLLRFFRSVLFLAILCGVAYLAHGYIAQSFFSSAALLIGTVAVVSVVFAVLLYIPGYLLRQYPVQKSVLDRLLEMFTLFCLMGVLGFAFEASIGNPFAQGWEFYSIALCLYVVLGYPGFVFRYLLKRRRVHPGVAKQAQKNKAAAS